MPIMPHPGMVSVAPIVSTFRKQDTAKWCAPPAASGSSRFRQRVESEKRDSVEHEANGWGPILVELIAMRELLEEQVETLMLGQRQLQATVGGVCNEVASLRTTSYISHEKTTPAIATAATTVSDESTVTSACKGCFHEVDKSAPLKEEQKSSAVGFSDAGSGDNDLTAAKQTSRPSICSEEEKGNDWDSEEESRPVTLRSRSNASLGLANSGRAVTARSYAHSLAEQELGRILHVHSNVAQLERAKSDTLDSKLGRRGSKSQVARKFAAKADATSFEMIFDSVIGAVILCNALFLGMSMDSPNANTGGWLVVECIFGVTFWIELVLKLWWHGWREQYCKKDSFSNIFDACLISVDTVQLFFTLFFASISAQLNSAGPSASLFRVVRLIRLTRILRLLRSQVFKDLLAMITGMMGGMSTLMWSVVLFILFIYVVSLIFREGLGPDPGMAKHEITQVEHYFDGVGRSMFTIFRCSFGDCSTDGGTPLFEHVTESKGGMWSFILSTFLFIVTIGLFNVISAIFVQSTLDSAAALAANKRRVKLDNEEHWAINIVALLKPILLACCNDALSAHDIENLDDGGATMELIDAILATEIPREVIDGVVREDKEVRKALNNLDIEQCDHRYLSDILDPDNGGTVNTRELVDGLKRLRGDPRRSDIITVDLMIRSMQEKVDEMWGWMAHKHGSEGQQDEARV